MQQFTTTSSPDKPDPRLSQIESALDVLLRAMTDHDRRRYEQAADEPKRFILGISDYADMKLETWALNPIGMALWEGVKSLGWQLFRITQSIEAMRKTREAVADLDPGCNERRIVIMEDAWNGVGDTDQWWCS